MTSTLPAKNEEYETKEYWDSRYSKEEDVTFDWFKSYDQIADVLKELIPNRQSRILMLGCGNSSLSQEMYDDGFEHIVNVDYSGVVIDQMRSRHELIRPAMTWHEMDVRDLSFPAESFDVVIDKGTMDAMMTSKGDVWEPPEKVVHDCMKEVDEVLRVLKPNIGVFIYLTFGQPHFRKRFLTRENTSLEIRTLGDVFHYFLYIIRA